MAKKAEQKEYKHSVTIKGESIFFVKKAGKSFGVLIKDAKGNEITKMYGSLKRALRHDRSETVADLIGIEEATVTRGKKTVKESISEADFATFVQFKKFMKAMSA